MKKAMTLTYETGGNLYLNITNKCPFATAFSAFVTTMMVLMVLTLSGSNMNSTLDEMKQART